MKTLLRMLDLAPLGDDRFRGVPGVFQLPRVFGGQVLAQGLVAAGRTLDTDTDTDTDTDPGAAKTAHSLHAYFLRAGESGVDIDYQVERVRDGRRLSCRSVTALQHGRPIATMLISFAQTDGRLSHQVGAPDSPRPESVPTLVEAAAGWGGLSPVWLGVEALELRIDPLAVEAGPSSQLAPGSPGDWTDHVWQRVPGALPPEQLLHQALLAYASDVTLLASALVPYGVRIGQEGVGGEDWDGVSLDHALWFHRPVRADDWMHFCQHSPTAGRGRALAQAQVFDPSGALVASVAQEGLLIGGLS